MHLIRFFTFCFVAYNCNRGQNFAFAFEWPHSHHVKTPLTCFVPTLATRILNYTGESVEIIPNPKTKEILTGGILGSEKFQYRKGRFYWETCNNKTSLKIRLYFYNTKYANFQDALNYPDGILQLYTSVDTSGLIHNPAFNAFEGIFKKHLKKTGDHAFINSFLSYKWYESFTDKSVYTSYREPFYDEETGQTAHHSFVLDCTKGNENFMSKKQFVDTFGSLRDSKGQILQNPAPKLTNHSPFVVDSKGISIVHV